VEKCRGGDVVVQSRGENGREGGSAGLRDAVKRRWRRRRKKREKRITRKKRDKEKGDKKR
jgi:hypothetical protein